MVKTGEEVRPSPTRDYIETKLMRAKSSGVNLIATVKLGSAAENP